MTASPAMFGQGKYGPSDPTAARHNMARAQTAKSFVKAQIREKETRNAEIPHRCFVTVLIRPEISAA